MLTWLAGGITLASVDALIASGTTVLAAPVPLFLHLVYIPLASLAPGCLSAAVWIVLRKTRAARLLEPPEAIAGAFFLSVSIFVFVSLVLLEIPSRPAFIFSPKLLPFYLVLFCLLSAVASRYLQKRAGENAFFESFIALTVGIFVLLEVMVIARSSPVIRLRSAQGLLFAAIVFAAVFLLARSTRRVTRAVSRYARIARLSTWAKAAAILAMAVAIDILLVAGITWWKDGLPPPKGKGSLLPDILLIVLDTARADRFSCYGGPDGLTPNTDRLAAEGVLFEDAVSTAPWTIPSHASIFTGTYPSTHAATWKRPFLDGSLRTLAGFLGRAGYTTYGFSNNPGIGRGTGFSRDFDVYVEVWRDSVRKPSLTDKAKFWLLWLLGRQDKGAALTNEKIAELLEDGDGGPLFLFINYIEPHLKYRPPHPFLEKHAGEGEVVTRMKNMGFPLLYDLLAGKRTLAPAERKALGDLYDGEIAYMDFMVGELLRELRAIDFLENTLVILTSDHGDNLGDHGLVDHQFSLHETLLEIPLIMRYPALLPRGARIRGLVQNVDIFPTILSLIERSHGARGDTALMREIAEARAQVQGQDLLEVVTGAPARDVAYAEYDIPRQYLEKLVAIHPGTPTSRLEDDISSIRAGHWKLVRNTRGERQLFDLGEDPGEDVDVAPMAPSVADSLGTLLETWVGSLPKGSGEADMRIDTETKEKLRALGYILE